MTQEPTTDGIFGLLHHLRDELAVVANTTLRLDNTINRLRTELSLEMQGLRDEMSELRIELRSMRRQQLRTTARLRQMESE